jgi:hypothetical protein
VRVNSEGVCLDNEDLAERDGLREEPLVKLETTRENRSPARASVAAPPTSRGVCSVPVFGSVPEVQWKARVRKDPYAFAGTGIRDE